MASVVSFQVEVFWIFLKKENYKFPLEDFIVSDCFFADRSLLRGYFCKIMRYDRQAKFNFHLLQYTEIEPLEVFVVLEVSKYSFHILRPLTTVFKTFGREKPSPFPFLIFLRRWYRMQGMFRSSQG